MMHRLLAVALLAAAPLEAQLPAADTGRVEMSGGTLYYEAAGSGPAVVLIHGGFGDRRMWDAQFRDLARDHRVVRYDHRHFGRSTPATGAYSPVADLARLMDHLGLLRADLVGNSMGGGFALEFALLRPERVRRLVVIASGAAGYPYPPEEVASIGAVFAAARAEGVDRAAVMWLAHEMVGVTSRDSATAPLLREMIQDNRAILTMQHWPEEPMVPSAWSRLGDLRVPTLFMVGSRDMPMVRAAAGAASRRAPSSRWLIIEGADHLPQMTHPGEVNEALRDFLDAP
jgi:3-oxoadipate enol-lactonase